MTELGRKICCSCLYCCLIICHNQDHLNSSRDQHPHPHWEHYDYEPLPQYQQDMVQVLCPCTKICWSSPTSRSLIEKRMSAATTQAIPLCLVSGSIQEQTVTVRYLESSHTPNPNLGVFIEAGESHQCILCKGARFSSHTSYTLTEILSIVHSLWYIKCPLVDRSL